MHIEISNLRKSFGSIEALNGLEFEIASGQFFGLLGPNGAGKSTFMNLLTGFHLPDSGSFQIDHKPYDPTNPRCKSRIGFVPQNIALYEEFTPVENLKMFGQLNGLSGSDLKDKIPNMLNRIGLADRQKDRVKTFSGGMKRRLNIASSLLHDPEILLCDEPTVGIDPQSRNAIFDLLQELNDSGTTVIYSTHYMEEAEKLCDRIAIIDHGKILAVGTIDELMSKIPTQNHISCKQSKLSQKITLSTLEQFGVIQETDSNLEIHTHENFKLSEFFAWLEENNLSPRLFRIQQSTLEDLFLQLTGRALRE
ncbi:ABC transporter ATP-binding protein [Puniceicoccaceae bacterium K14]|nr:ABC transporter ATP-binding protein [Puniceicoccaceae bacterium K14]